MPFMNARCNACGTIFPSVMEIPDDGDDMRVSNIVFGPCPNCGGSGPLIADGLTISVSGGNVTVPRGGISKADLAIITSVLSPFQLNGRSKKATQQAIAKVLPELAPEINKLNEGQLAVLLAFIIGLFTFLQNQLNSDSASVQGEQIIQLIREQTAAIQKQTEQAQRSSDRSFQLDQERNDLLRQQSELLKEHLKEAPEQHEGSHPQQKPGGK
ncbi:hypothetical protein [Deinococcus marmoris]|uniref:hypothetical protein n=1 Tax=Deinococcus marmoris TaxID=249408 RepID=UPI001115077C|nr:hypothetical protein [Deinococcus marmoris]